VVFRTISGMSRSLPLSPVVRRTDLLARLDLEWDALRRRPSVVQRASRWQLGITFVSLDEIVCAAGFWSTREARLAAATRPSAEGPSADEVLVRLVTAARHDPVAARVVLQRLLPGLVARARRWVGHDDDAEAVDELVTAAWTVIRTYPIERRSAYLVARLLRDTEYQAFVKPTRRLGTHTATDPARLDRPAPVERDPEPLAELAELVAIGRATVLTDDDIELVRLLVSGRPLHEVAAERKVSVRTVWNHRESLVHRLRQVALAA
jgi:DNA-binding CsgD family transcriptional regulator